MSQKYNNVEDAEASYGLDVDFYLSDASTIVSQSQEPLRLDEKLISSIKSLTQQQLQEAFTHALAAVKDKKAFLLKILGVVQLSSTAWIEIIECLYQQLPYQEKMVLLDKQFADVAIAEGIDTNPADFASISLGAMKVLQESGKPNLHRMPFGLMQYQMEFFTSTNVMQVRHFFVDVVLILQIVKFTDFKSFSKKKIHGAQRFQTMRSMVARHSLYKKRKLIWLRKGKC